MGRTKSVKTTTKKRRTKTTKELSQDNVTKKTGAPHKRTKTARKKYTKAQLDQRTEMLAEVEVPYLAPPVRVEQPDFEALVNANDPDYVDYNPNGIRNAKELISALRDVVHPYPHLVLAEEIFTDSDIVISRDVTLDLNGHNIIATKSGSQVLKIKGGNVVLTGGGKESHIFAEAPGSLAIRVYGSANALVTEHAHVTIDRDITLFASASYGVLVRANIDACYGVKVNLRGKIIARDGVAIHENVQNVQGAPIINLEDSAEIAAEHAAVRSDGYGVWEIGNAKLSGNYGLNLRAGVANLNNTQITTSGLDIGENDAAMINHGRDFEALLSAARDPEALAQVNAMLGGGAIKIENHPQYRNSVAITIDGGNYLSRSGYVFFEDNCRAAAQHPALRDFTILSGQFVGALGIFSPDFSEVVHVEDGEFSNLAADEQQLVHIEAYQGLFEPTPEKNFYWLKNDSPWSGNAIDSEKVNYLPPESLNISSDYQMFNTEDVAMSTAYNNTFAPKSESSENMPLVETAQLMDCKLESTETVTESESPEKDISPVDIATKLEADALKPFKEATESSIGAEDQTESILKGDFVDQEEAETSDWGVASMVFEESENSNDPFLEIGQSAGLTETLGFECLPYQPQHEEEEMSDWDLEEAWNSAKKKRKTSEKSLEKSKRRNLKLKSKNASNHDYSNEYEQLTSETEASSNDEMGNEEIAINNIEEECPTLPAVISNIPRAELVEQPETKAIVDEENQIAELTHLKTALSEAIISARNLKVTDYSSGFTELQTTILSATTVYLDQSSTLENIRDVTLRLADALENLVEKKATPILESVEQKSEETNASYFCLMDNDLISASHELNNFLASSVYPKQELDFSSFEQISAHILALSAHNYAADEYNNLLTLLSDSQALVDSPELTQGEIDAAVYELNLALSALQPLRQKTRSKKVKSHTGFFGSLKAGAAAGISAYRHSRLEAR